VVRDALGVALLGTLIGGAVAFAAAPLLQPMLFDNPARDPRLLLLLAAGLAVTALLASLVPSWRASHINPMVALNTD
jgi:ABC-type lipoprotein release transport system permease subunit